MHLWDRTDQGPPLWSGDFLGLTTADELNSYARCCKPCAIRYRSHTSSSGSQ